jgi:hypothetical protein
MSTPLQQRQRTSRVQTIVSQPKSDNVQARRNCHGSEHLCHLHLKHFLSSPATDSHIVSHTQILTMIFSETSFRNKGKKSINVSDSNVPRNITRLSLPKFALAIMTSQPSYSLSLRYFMMIDRHAAWRWNCKLILRHFV